MKNASDIHLPKSVKDCGYKNCGPDARAMNERPKYGTMLVVGPVGVSNSIICLLDDDPSFLEATGRLLSSLGWTSEQFTDPHAFLDYARTRQPRLAVIDICMPVMHGLDVQTRLRIASPSTEIIILTARDDHSVRRKAMAGGASAFLLKAGGEDELVARVRLLSSES